MTVTFGDFSKGIKTGRSQEVWWVVGCLPLVAVSQGLSSTCVRELESSVES